MCEMYKKCTAQSVAFGRRLNCFLWKKNGVFFFLFFFFPTVFDIFLLFYVSSLSTGKQRVLFCTRRHIPIPMS